MVSLSGACRLTRDQGYGSKAMVIQYAKREEKYSQLSFHKYFIYIKNYRHKDKNHITIVPHYVGAYHQPCYPPTELYAKSIMMVHYPWRHKFDDSKRNFISEFEIFVASSGCPDIVKIPYKRMKQRYLTNSEHVEPTT